MWWRVSQERLFVDLVIPTVELQLCKPPKNGKFPTNNFSVVRIRYRVLSGPP